MTALMNWCGGQLILNREERARQRYRQPQGHDGCGADRRRDRRHPAPAERPYALRRDASRDTECIALSRQRWTELLTNSPDLALRWMASIARRLDDDRRRLVVVTSKPLLGQVAYLLLDLVEDGPGSQQVVKLSHTTVAHLLGARRQSGTRVMAELKRRSPNCHALRRDRE